MSAPDDSDLRDAFEALGTRGSATAPTFADLASPEALNSARWRRRWRRTALLVAVFAIPAVFAWRAQADDGLDYERFTALTGIDLGEVSWEAPSDFLLDVPGRDLLRGVPLIEIRAPVLAPDSLRTPLSNDTNRRPRS